MVVRTFCYVATCPVKDIVPHLFYSLLRFTTPLSNVSSSRFVELSNVSNIFDESSATCSQLQDKLGFEDRDYIGCVISNQLNLVNAEPLRFRPLEAAPPRPQPRRKRARPVCRARRLALMLGRAVCLRMNSRRMREFSTVRRFFA